MSKQGKTLCEIFTRMDTNELPQRLKTRREALGVSLESAARQLGVSLSTYQRWERGRSVPRGNNDLRVIEAWLAGGEPTK